ncbi:MAG TPA: hypothetical protein VIY48_11155 [Candidatus Paceibacterota bacterium]
MLTQEIKSKIDAIANTLALECVLGGRQLGKGSDELSDAISMWDQETYTRAEWDAAVLYFERKISATIYDLRFGRGH